MPHAAWTRPARLLGPLAVLFLAVSASAPGTPEPALPDSVWSPTGSMATTRRWHTLTLLPDGNVLVAGGRDATGYHSSSEVFDSASGRWLPSGSMEVARFQHTATLLPNGKVLVAGGFNGGYLKSCEIYDPATRTWSATGSMAGRRYFHTATLLPGGKVLVVGGNGGGDPPISSEIYDLLSGTWSVTEPMLDGWRPQHAATLLTDGRVLVSGGQDRSSCEIFTPLTGKWSATGSMQIARNQHTATILRNGKILVAGGYAGAALASCEVYDPASGTWSITGSISIARRFHATLLLPSGNVLAVGGYTTNGLLSSCELFDPMSETWTFTDSMDWARGEHSATLLPNGKVLVVDGFGFGTCEIYHPRSGQFIPTGPLANGRQLHSSTLLPDGRVLVAGGHYDGPLSTCETYDPTIGEWSETGALSTPRYEHTATLLPSGKVLVVGGVSAGGSCELYDPASGTWSQTGSTPIPIYRHTATLLPDGKVLVVGDTSQAQVYDPPSSTWSPTGSSASNRRLHTATLLHDGKVLVVGGFITQALSSTECYDPATGLWSSTGSLANARYMHSATLLPSGKVLVAGGNANGDNPMSSCELFDPATGTWSVTSSMSVARHYHKTTLLPNGDVLAVGGSSPGGFASMGETYDPSTGRWAETGPLEGARVNHATTLLPSGKVLVTGGYSPSGHLSACEVFNPTDVDDTWRPSIASIAGSSAFPVTIPFGGTISVTGTGFNPRSEGSGGNGVQNSSVNYPLVRLLGLSSTGQTANDSTIPRFFMREATDWADGTNLTVTMPQPTNNPDAYYLLYIITNGIPSEGKIIKLTSAPPNAPPTAVVEAPNIVECTTQGGVDVTLDASGSRDPEEMPLTYFWETRDGITATGPKPTVTLNVGTYEFTLTVTDEGGLTSTYPFTVVVEDTQAPVLSGVRANMIVEQTSPTTTPVEIAWPTAMDACEGPIQVTVEADHPEVFPSGTAGGGGPFLFPPGPTLITFRAVDASRNAVEATMLVTVQDTTPPRFQAPTLGAGGGWISQFGSPGYDIAWAVAQDRSGNTYVAGSTDGTLPGPPLGGGDAILRKYRPDGGVDWEIQFGTDAQDGATAVAVDDGGNVYVGGNTNGAFPGDGNALSGPHDSFLSKYSAGGVHQWTKQFGTAASFGGYISDSVGGIATDAPGNIYVVGQTLGALPGQTHLGGPGDAYIRKFLPDGNAVWTRQFGTTSDEAAVSVCVSGSVVSVAGHTNGVLAGQTSMGGVDGFLCQFGTDGTPGPTRQFGAESVPQGWPFTGFDTARGVAADALGNVFVTGRTTGIFPGETRSGGIDHFVTVFRPVGNDPLQQHWTRQFGPSGSEGDGNGFQNAAADGLGNVFVAGMVNGHIVVRKYDIQGREVWTTQLSGGSPRGISWADGAVAVAGSTYGITGQPSFGGSDAFALRLVEETVVTVECTGALTPVFFTLPAATDLCDTNPTVTANPPPGSLFPLGTTPVTVTATDSKDNSATTRITIKVVDTTPPVANGQAVTVNEDTPVPITLTGTDLSGVPLSYTVTGGPANGVLTGSAPDLVYQPGPDYNGDDAFTFTTNDGTHTSAPATVSITVTPVNDPPVPADDEIAILEDNVVDIPVYVNDMDVDSAIFKVAGIFQPALGWVDAVDGGLRFTPYPDFYGVVTFRYTLFDGKAESTVQATVTVTISPVNDPPATAPDAYFVDKGTARSVAAPGVLANDSDVEGDPLTASLVTPPSQGILQFNSDGSFSYDPPSGFTGVMTFSYQALDSADRSRETWVTLTVTAPNNPPDANADAYGAIAGTPLSVPASQGVLANDSDKDGDMMTAVLVSGPSNGSLTLNPDGSFTYIPGSTAPDSFQYKANDGRNDSAVATVSITISATNAAPEARNDSYTAVPGERLVVVATAGILANDSDPDANPLTAILVAAPAEGTLALAADGSFTYTQPAGGIMGGDPTFTYQVSDGAATSTIATVTIKVKKK